MANLGGGIVGVALTRLRFAAGAYNSLASGSLVFEHPFQLLTEFSGVLVTVFLHSVAYCNVQYLLLGSRDFQRAILFARIQAAVDNLSLLSTRFRHVLLLY